MRKCSNSKLTQDQKSARKAMWNMLADFNGNMVNSDCGKVTIAYMPEFVGSRMLTLAVSNASPSELKIRRKVGEYHAMNNLFYGRSIVVFDGIDMFALANVLADAV